MAGWTGLEPATSDVTGRRSNQLNYHPAKVVGGGECRGGMGRPGWWAVLRRLDANGGRRMGRRREELTPGIHSSFTREASGTVGQGRFPGSRVNASPPTFPGSFFRVA